jgi:hypothetical protein
MTVGAAGPPGPVTPPRGNTYHRRTNDAGRLARRSIFTIDVSRQVAEIERVLRAGGELTRCMDALAVLERWQFDDMLDNASRKKASVLLREFAAYGRDDVWRR